MAEPLLILTLHCKYKTQRLRFISDYSHLRPSIKTLCVAGIFKYALLSQLFSLFGMLEWKIFLLHFSVPVVTQLFLPEFARLLPPNFTALLCSPQTYRWLETVPIDSYQ